MAGGLGLWLRLAPPHRPLLHVSSCMKGRGWKTSCVVESWSFSFFPCLYVMSSACPPSSSLTGREVSSTFVMWDWRSRNHLGLRQREKEETSKRQFCFRSVMYVFKILCHTLSDPSSSYVIRSVWRVTMDTIHWIFYIYLIHSIIRKLYVKWKVGHIQSWVKVF